MEPNKDDARHTSAVEQSNAFESLRVQSSELMANRVRRLERELVDAREALGNSGRHVTAAEERAHTMHRRAQAAESETRATERRLAQVAFDRDAYLENLTRTQAQCSAIERENRAWRRLVAHLSGVSDLWDEAFSDLLPLVEAMRRARAKHPFGATALALFDEVGEFAHAVNKDEGTARVEEELLDVAVVAMRLYLGEVAK